eukprot:TRINITY_DN6781_c0_g1_i1.p1 TRINITY_DN6781_c0_g1~~TRINITY_DN6781_c0_g1_i1.p1  ORF type:complete len:467 (-),score=43.56 TRINITY_DN6781_c0_g1_i1:118-1518(-)
MESAAQYNGSDMSITSASIRMQSPELVLFGKVGLSEGTTPLNFYGKLVLAFGIGLCFFVQDSLFIILLTSPKHGVLEENVGKTVANINIFDLIVRLASGPITGVILDRFGRRPVVVIGCILLAAGIATMPYMPSIYPHLVLNRALIGLTSGLVIQAPLIADYTHNDYKGRVAGITSLFMLGGSVIGGIFLQRMLKHVPLEFLYSFYASGLVIISAICAATLRGGIYHVQNEKSPRTNSRSMIEDIMTGFKIAKKVPWILITFVVGFLSGGEIPLIAGLFILWVQTFYGKDKTSRDEANSRATLLNLCIKTSVLIMTVTLSALADKISKFILLIPGFIFVFLGFLGVILVQSPQSWLTVISVVTIGLGFGTIMIMSGYLSARYSPKEHRGKVMGAHSTLRVLGTIMSTVVGGYMFDMFTKDAPYIMFITFSAIGLLIILRLFFTRGEWEARSETSGIEAQPIHQEIG